MDSLGLNALEAFCALGVVLLGTLVYLFVATAPGSTGHDAKLEITQIHVYPVKSLRGCSVDKARIGPRGFVGDRTFCILQVHRDAAGEVTKHETMMIGHHLPLALFIATVDYDRDEVTVRWSGRGTQFEPADLAKTDDSGDDVIRFPLRPSLAGRSTLHVALHRSETDAYDMGDDLSAWFAARLGVETRFAFIGDGARPVLGSLAPNSPAGLQRARLAQRAKALLLPWTASPPETLTFSDIAHYLVVTEESNDQVTSRLDAGCAMDVSKFRPNIVVRGASAPFVEDFWGELGFDGLRMPLTANCYRCQSITVDYETGATALDDRGKVWKKINSDRRVDKGATYSPVFGRYGYCSAPAVGNELRVGQAATVTRVNAERTVFDWKLR